MNNNINIGDIVQFQGKVVRIEDNKATIINKNGITQVLNIDFVDVVMPIHLDDRWSFLPKTGEWGRFKGRHTIYHRIGNLFLPYYNSGEPFKRNYNYYSDIDWIRMSLSEVISVFKKHRL